VNSPVLRLTALALVCLAPRLPAQELLLPGGPFEATAVPAGARGEWLALLIADGGARVAPVQVSVENVTEECTDSPGAARLVHAVGPLPPLALLRRVPGVRTGPVYSAPLEPAREWREPQGGEFDGRPFVLREERVGEGFRLRYAWGGALETVYETELEDEGHWELLWLGDLNRDRWPDLLLQADGKYSRHTIRLLLSRRHRGSAVLEEIASFGISAC
jgi:hypothetical protein